MAGKAKYTMHHSTVLDASPDAVWAEVRDVVTMVKIVFGGAAEDVRWGEDGAVERVPSLYQFRLPTGDVAHQEIVGRDEVTRSVTYRMRGRAVCIYDYLATYRVVPVTNDPGRCYFEWTRDYRITDDAVPDVVTSLVGMMDNQINVLRDYFR